LYQSMILPIWRLLDRIYYHSNRLQFVDRLDENIFRVRLTKYRGYPLQMEDGTRIIKGDLLVKIHLHNYLLVKKMVHLKSDVKRALFAHEIVKESMPGLAHFIKSHPQRDRIKGVIGVTVLNRGIKRLGFHSFELKNPFYRNWKRLYMAPLTALCQGKWSHLWNDKLEPKYLVMSKDTLLGTYDTFEMGKNEY